MDHTGARNHHNQSYLGLSRTTVTGSPLRQGPTKILATHGSVSIAYANFGWLSRHFRTYTEDRPLVMDIFRDGVILTRSRTLIFHSKSRSYKRMSSNLSQALFCKFPIIPASTIIKRKTCQQPDGQPTNDHLIIWYGLPSTDTQAWSAELVHEQVIYYKAIRWRWKEPPPIKRIGSNSHEYSVTHSIIYIAAAVYINTLIEKCDQPMTTGKVPKQS